MLGIDVSNVNGPVDWAKVAAAGVHFAYAKATEGLTFNDGLFAHHRDESAKHGIHFGAYHFARPDRNGAVAEARHFSRVVCKLRASELRPALDFEHPAHLTPAQMVAWARDWNHEVKRLLGNWPLFYSYPSFINGMHLSRSVGKGLWLASYGPNDGKEHPDVVPAPFKQVFMHQFTSKGHVSGVGGVIDLDAVGKLGPLLAHPVLGRVVHLKHKIGGKPPRM